MGLYGERIGALHMVLPDKKIAKNVKSQIRSIIRNNYSTPPHHGAAIVTTILSNKELHDKWKEELKQISLNLNNMRWKLRHTLEKNDTPGDWKHITD